MVTLCLLDGVGLVGEVIINVKVLSIAMGVMCIPAGLFYTSVHMFCKPAAMHFHLQEGILPMGTNF